MRSLLRVLPRLALVPMILLVQGCGGKPVAKIVPVSGKITLDKKPLVGATVRFVPLTKGTGPVSDAYGETDSEGKYTLKPSDPGTSGSAERHGAMPGESRVEITLFDRAAGPAGVEKIPPQYNVQSKLKFTVPAEGTTEANFDLTNK